MIISCSPRPKNNVFVLDLFLILVLYLTSNASCKGQRPSSSTAGTSSGKERLGTNPLLDSTLEMIQNTFCESCPHVEPEKPSKKALSDRTESFEFLDDQHQITKKTYRARRSSTAAQFLLSIPPIPDSDTEIDFTKEKLPAESITTIKLASTISSHTSISSASGVSEGELLRPTTVPRQHAKPAAGAAGSFSPHGSYTTSGPQRTSATLPVRTHAEDAPADRGGRADGGAAPRAKDLEAGAFPAPAAGAAAGRQRLHESPGSGQGRPARGEGPEAPLSVAAGAAGAAGARPDEAGRRLGPDSNATSNAGADDVGQDSYSTFGTGADAGGPDSNSTSGAGADAGGADSNATSNAGADGAGPDSNSTSGAGAGDAGPNSDSTSSAGTGGTGPDSNATFKFGAGADGAGPDTTSEPGAGAGDPGPAPEFAVSSGATEGPWPPGPDFDATSEASLGGETPGPQPSPTIDGGGLASTPPPGSAGGDSDASDSDGTPPDGTIPNGTSPDAGGDSGGLCPCGYFCEPGADNPSACPAGSYCPAGSAWPTLCEAGTHCPADGLCEPVPCTCSFFCPLDGMTAGELCPFGSFCDPSNYTSCAFFEGVICLGALPCPRGVMCAGGDPEGDPACWPGTCEAGFCCENPLLPYEGECAAPAPVTARPVTTVLNKGNFLAAVAGVVPESGMLHPGSGGLALTIRLHNVDWAADRPAILVGGLECPFDALRPYAYAADGDLVLRCRAPELPLSMCGMVEIRVALGPAKSGSTGLRWEWRYDPPPGSFIDAWSVAVDGRVGPPLWAANGTSADLSFLVYNVAPWSGRSLKNVALGNAVGGPVGFFQVGFNVIVTFSVQNTGLVDPAASLMLETQVLAAADVYWSETLLPVGMEIRDPRQPRLVALAPTEGPSTQSTLLMLGITSCPDLRQLVNSVENISCIFDLGIREIPGTIYKVIDLADGGGQNCGQFQQLVGGKSSIPSRFITVPSEELVFQYESVCSATYALSIQVKSSDNFLVFVQSPVLDFPMQDSRISWPATVRISKGATELLAEYDFVLDPEGDALVFAQTQDNELSCGLAGNVLLSITLTNFAIINSISELKIIFGSEEVPVQRLVSSSSLRTKLTIIVPASTRPSFVNVTVYPARLPSNLASFLFEYFDDDNPSIVDYFPDQVYSSPGGTNLQVSMIHFPDVSLDLIYLSIEIGNTVLPLTSAHTVSTHQQTEKVTTVSFLTPSSSNSGAAKFSVLVPSLFKQTAPISLEMILLPSTKARIGRLSPSTGSSQGGIWISADLTNIRMIQVDDVVVSNISLRSKWQLKTCTVITTSRTLSTVTFMLPSFEFGGLSSVSIWIEGEENLAGTASFLFEDPFSPEIKFRFPSMGFLGQETKVEISIANFGDVWNKLLFQVVPNQFLSGFVEDLRASTDGSILLVLKLTCLIKYPKQNITIKYCKDGPVCSVFQTVEFDFNCLADEPSVLSFQPTSMSTDGFQLMNVTTVNIFPVVVQNMTQLKVRMLNPKDRSFRIIPLTGISATLPYSPDQINGSEAGYSTVSSARSKVVMHFIIPEAQNRTICSGLLLSLETFGSSEAMAGSSLSLPFPGTFAYTQPLPLNILSLIPTRAQKNLSTFVTISIQNFPKINELSDIVIEFITLQSIGYGGVYATVQSFTPQDFSNQIVNIVFESPKGSRVSDGFSDMVIYHSSYQERKAYHSGFLFVDQNSPEVVSMFSENGNVGLKSLAVRKSTKTQITVVISSVTVKPTSVLVGSFEVDLILSNIDLAIKTARASFVLPSIECEDPCAPVHGLVLFSNDCSGCTNAFCCSNSTCTTECGSGCEAAVACFTLTYENDLMPSVIFQSVSQGGSSGGTSIRMRIKNFPPPASESDLSVQFLDDRIIGSVIIVTVSEVETEVVIVTPTIVMKEQHSIIYSENTLLSNSRPSRFLLFPFAFLKTQPSLLSVYPTSGSQVGNVLISVKIANFPISSNIGISFGDLDIPQDQIKLEPSSTFALATVSFKTLASAATGLLNCQIYPKECPFDCDQAASFQFYQAADVQIMDPVPGQCARLSCEVSVRLMNFPLKGMVDVIFHDNMGYVVLSLSKVQVEIAGSVTTATFQSPARTGDFVCNLNILSVDQNATISFPYRSLSSLDSVIISVEPTAASVNFEVKGVGRLMPRTELSILIANFPQNLSSNDIIFTSQGEIGEILSMETFEISCDEAEIVGCSRTRVVLLAPALDAPGNFKVQIVFRVSILSSESKDSNSLTETREFQNDMYFYISYFYPCSFESFCASNFMISNIRKILQSPPTSSSCEISFCTEASNIADPELFSVSPSHGPATGGTLVLLAVRDFPVVPNQNVRIIMGSGAQQVEISAAYVLNHDESIFTKSTIDLSFTTPRVPGGETDVQSNVVGSISIFVGSVLKQVPFVFQFTPVTQGPAVVVNVYPSIVNSAITTSIYVTLNNFPKLTVNDTSRISATSMCANFRLFRASEIQDSTYRSTTIIIPITETFDGVCPVIIYVEEFGDDSVASFSLLFRPGYHPVVQYWFPQIADWGNQVIVVILYLNPHLNLDNFEVKIRNVSVRPIVSYASFVGPSNCSSPECSKFSIGIMLPNVTNTLVVASIEIAATGISKPARFELPLHSDSGRYPTIQSIYPSTLVVSRERVTDISVYLVNSFDFCKEISSCVVKFGLMEGVVLQTVVKGDQRILVLRAPALRDDSELSCTLSDRGIVLEFCSIFEAIRLTIVPLPLLVEPVDFPCSGGTKITVSAIGWSQVLHAEMKLALFLGSKNCSDLEIIDIPGTDYSTLAFSVTTPRFGALSTSIQGYANFNGETIPFPILLDCYEEPLITVNPSVFASNSISTGGRLVTVDLQNFPALLTLNDIELKFGDDECDSEEMSCRIMDFQNFVTHVTLTVSVPPYTAPKVVEVIGSYRGDPKLPAGGDPNITYKRTRKAASTSFVYTIRLPQVISVEFCSVCNIGPMCIVNEQCGGHQDSPLLNVMGLSGLGTLVVVIENVQEIPFDRSTGAVLPPAAVYINLGVTVGVVQRIIYSDSSRIALEVRPAGPLPAGRLSSQVIVQSDVSSPVLTVAGFQVQVFDDNVNISCLSGCSGPSLSGPEATIWLSGIRLSAATLSDLITVRFGDMLAASVRFVEYSDLGTILAVVPPNFTCGSCSFSVGAATVPLRILYSTSSMEIARLQYTFWDEPKIYSALFNTAGTSVVVVFDQGTNQAFMNESFADCSFIFDGTELGNVATCSWQTDYQVTILLGEGASLLPGSIIKVKPSASLRSANGLSAVSMSQAPVVAPVFEPAEVSLTGVSVVDLCTPLELRAFMPSPRTVMYSWSCLNDVLFDSYLATLSGPTLRLAAGTPELQSAGKTFTIAVSALSFLGGSSSQATIQVLKQSSPAPQVKFTPTSMTITRDKAAFVSGLAEFSGCPVKQDDLAFEWRLVSGPENTPLTTILQSNIPQLYIPPMTLVAGSVYVLALRTTMKQDISKNSDSFFTLSVGYQPLVATIDGMSKVFASPDKALSLSASSSVDPDGSFDLMGLPDQSLDFAWECSTANTNYKSACRDTSGSLLILKKGPRLEIPPGTLNPLDVPYVFQVSVSKPGKPFAFASVQVYMLSVNVPTLSTSVSCFRSEDDQRPCCIAKDGAIISNIDSKIVLTSLSDTANTTFQWSWSSSTGLNSSDALFQLDSNVFVLQGSASVFVQGNSYTLKLIGTAGRAQSQAETVLLINYPPTGGRFSACLLDESDVSDCITTGLSVLDTFRLECNSWTDPEGDSMLLYRFGYSLDTMQHNVSSTYWFDWSRSAVKDVSLPAGLVIVMAQIQDDCGGQTKIQTALLNVISDSPDRRRLLASGNFWDVAKAKIQTAIQTFRSDTVSQLGRSLSMETSRVLPGSPESADVQRFLLLALNSSVVQAALTSGYICEVLGTTARITDDYKSLGSDSISVAANLIDFLTGPSIDGGAVSLRCATQAATVVANILRAVSRDLKHQALGDIAQLQAGLSRYIRQLLKGSVTGETRRIAVGSELTLVAFRASVDDLQSHFSVARLPAGLSSESRSSDTISVHMPSDFAGSVFGTDKPIVDGQIESYARAPSSQNMSIMSGFYCLNVGSAETGIMIKALSEPILITIPINAFLGEEISTVEPNQLSCVNWHNNTYINSSCKMHKVKIDESGKILQVTCACAQLPVSMMAVAMGSNFLLQKMRNLSQTVIPVLKTSPLRNGTVQIPTANSKAQPAAYPPSHQVSQDQSSTVEVGGNPGTMINIILYLAACTLILALFLILCVQGIANLIVSRIRILEQARDDEKQAVVSSDLVIFCSD